MNWTHWLGIVIGILLAGFSVIFFSGNLLYFVLALAFIVVVFPFMIGFVVKQREQREKEEKFLEFTRDLVEIVRTGAPISKGVMNLKKRNYGALSPHVAKLANQLSIGITLTSAMTTFARETKSKVISRAVGLISEAERAGGRIEVILQSVAVSVNQVEKLRKERKAAISNLITQGYLIFIIFIIIMLVLEFKILPLVSDLQQGEGLSVAIETVGQEQFSLPLFVMLLVQSFFAGLVIGKISEGSIKNGFKHSFILLTVTLLVTTGARALFG
ncbi:type II secretion system F family protein [Candidatus Pacearchaeota archaeon]|nr:type II secretion system F family protein [Candidatus Pacearchaeota archaeon]